MRTGSRLIVVNVGTSEGVKKAWESRERKPHEMTKKEYHSFYNDSYIAGHPDVSKAEMEDAYPMGSRNQDHIKAVLDANLAGEKIPGRVLDDDENIRFRLTHDYPDKY